MNKSRQKDRRLNIGKGRLGLAWAFLAMLIASSIMVESCKGPKTKPQEMNFLWIVIDDLKASHLGAAGYAREITPNLDALARTGVRFERCVTQAPWSLPSYASMLTSRYPYELVMGKPYKMHVMAETEVARSRDPFRMPDKNLHWYAAAPENVTTIAQILERRGIATAAWINNPWLSPNAYGLERGFDHYFDGTEGDGPYAPADVTADLAMEWIEQNKDGRWFAFVQFMDPHKPHLEHEGIDHGERIIDRYDAEIQFTDGQIGRLMEGVERLGLFDKTIIVVGSDHGEGVFENDKDFVGHGGGVIPEIVRVPLIIKWPGGPNGKVVSGLCRNLDIMPTALELMGIEDGPSLRGVSLLGMIGGDGEAVDVAYTSSVLKGPERVSAIVRDGPGGDFYQGVATPAYKDLRFYPLEKKGDRQIPPSVQKRLAILLDSFVREAARSAEASEEESPRLSEKTKASLKSLGYLQ